MVGEVSFIELGVGEVERAQTFYGELFGWRFEPGPSGEEAGATVEMPGIAAGMHPDDAGVWPYVFFRVDDLEAAVERVEELGGSVDAPPGESADVGTTFGRFRMCQDDQGSRFGLHEPPSGS
jgi:predicted enzyme related to lactoylglutathione lyase